MPAECFRSVQSNSWSFQKTWLYLELLSLDHFMVWKVVATESDYLDEYPYFKIVCYWDEITFSCNENINYNQTQRSVYFQYLEDRWVLRWYHLWVAQVPIWSSVRSSVSILKDQRLLHVKWESFGKDTHSIKLKSRVGTRFKGFACEKPMYQLIRRVTRRSVAWLDVVVDQGDALMLFWVNVGYDGRFIL